MKGNRVVIRNCRLIGELTEGTDLSMADIILEGEYISKIIPCGMTVEGEYDEIDAAGSTVMPGLIDAHVHLAMGKEYTGFMIPTPCGRVFDCVKYAQFLLKHGFTTVRDMGDYDCLPTVALRDAIDEGIIVGPRIKTSGVTISTYESGFMVEPDFNIFIHGPIEMRKAVRTVLMNGADQVKIYGTGSMLTMGSEPGLRILEEDEISEAVKIARRKQTYVACHCHGAEAIDVMVRCGVRSIEHASFITEETCKMLDDRTDIGIVPTVSVLCDEMIAGISEEKSKRFKELQEKVYRCIRNAYENHHILMGWGTDLRLSEYENNPYVEFRTRKEALGFSDIDILKQVTINNAVIMEMDHQVGSIKEGKLADLIIVNGRPDEDIHDLFHKPEFIIKGGKMVVI